MGCGWGRGELFRKSVIVIAGDISTEDIALRGELPLHVTTYIVLLEVEGSIRKGIYTAIALASALQYDGGTTECHHKTPMNVGKSVAIHREVATLHIFTGGRLSGDDLVASSMAAAVSYPCRHP